MSPDNNNNDFRYTMVEWRGYALRAMEDMDKKLEDIDKKLDALTKQVNGIYIRVGIISGILGFAVSTVMNVII